jgi:glycosyltransferase involved in cell wall biosynthesis
LNIYYIHQYFLPACQSAEASVPSVGNRPYEFAIRWVRQGHRVTMFVIDDGRMKGIVEPVSRGWFSNRYHFDGLDVIAYRVAYNQKMNMLQKSLSFVKSVVLISFGLLFAKRPDIVYASSTPLTVGVPALLARWFRRIPFVFEIRDQWPEIPIQMGLIRNRPLIKFLLWLEKTIYKNALGVVALSPGMAKGVKAITPDKAVEVASNCADTQVFKPGVDGSALRQKYGWENKFILLHAGTMGRVNSLGFLINVAEKLQSQNDIHLVLIGRGNEQPILKKRVQQLQLSNVTILDPVPRPKVVEFYGAADVGMVVFGNYPILEDNSANKFFDSLSAGVPTLTNYGGWHRQLLEQNRAGFGCTQYDVDEFVEKVRYLKDHPQEALQMGQNARKLAVEQFDRDLLARRALGFIIKCRNTYKGFPISPNGNEEISKAVS